MNNFLESVLNPLMPFRDEIDELALKELASQMFFQGYSIEDAISELRLTEHHNPNLDEDYACREMEKIAKKYSKGQLTRPLF